MTLDELLAIGQALKEKHGGQVQVAYMDMENGGFLGLDGVELMHLYQLPWGFDYSRWNHPECSKTEVPVLILR